MAKMIDHSLLNPTLSVSELEAGIRLAVDYDVGSVCILPYYLRRCADLLHGSSVRASTTIGFPHGGHKTSVKAFEAGEFGPGDLEEMFDDAVNTAIRDMEDADIDVITDGEARRTDGYVDTYYKIIKNIAPLPVRRKAGPWGYDQQQRYEATGRIELPAAGFGLEGAALAPGIDGLTLLFAGGFFFLFELSYEVIYDLRDAPGDAEAGVLTYPVVHGERGAVRIIDGLIAASVLFLVVGYAAGHLPWRIFVMVLAPLLQLVLYKRALRRGITSADCVGITWLGAALLLAYHLWIVAGLPGVSA